MEKINLDRLLTLEELVPYTGRKLSTLRVDVSRRPETLPARWQVPGTRKCLWRLRDVLAWMEDNSQPAPKRKKGAKRA
ncbi:MAG TPA: hypothetical protein VFM48_08620 [Aquabacterium sp.]|nr:hypothetical protein [Aquabacterium sp.]